MIHPDLGYHVLLMAVEDSFFSSTGFTFFSEVSLPAPLNLHIRAWHLKNAPCSRSLHSLYRIYRSPLAGLIRRTHNLFRRKCFKTPSNHLLKTSARWSISSSCRPCPQCPLENLLAHPYCLAPPKLGVGEFHADTDETSIEEAFRKHAGANGTVRHA